MCIKRKISSCQLHYILQQIFNLIDQIQIFNLIDQIIEVIILHTFREGNKVVDCLSNLGYDGITNFTLNPSTTIVQYKDLQKLITNELVDYHQ